MSRFADLMRECNTKVIERIKLLNSMTESHREDHYLFQIKNENLIQAVSTIRCALNHGDIKPNFIYLIQGCEFTYKDIVECLITERLCNVESDKDLYVELMVLQVLDATDRDDILKATFKKYRGLRDKIYDYYVLKFYKDSDHEVIQYMLSF